MRRHSRFTAYNPKTIAAVKGIFESWQIPSRDAREGMHSLVNGVANTADLLADEFRYMARRFLPLTADLSEAWILYRADLACSSLYRNGEPLEESVTQVSTIDDLVDGYPTSFSAAGVVRKIVSSTIVAPASDAKVRTKVKMTARVKSRANRYGFSGT